MRWLNAMPFPPIALEIGPESVSGARWSRTGGVEAFASRALPPGAIVPSATETNLVDAAAVLAAVASVCKQLNAQDEETTVLLADTVVRVFVQRFQEFPRSPQEALPMLRWKLKKSVPFDMGDTVLSYVQQPQKNEDIEVVAAVARLSIVREYEWLVESSDLRVGVVSSSAMAALALLDDQGPTLFARISGATLTTAVVRDGVLYGYRCTELPAKGSELAPQMLLDEIYPVAAYYQDNWKTSIERMKVAGLGDRLPQFAEPLERELHSKVHPLLDGTVAARCTAQNATALLSANQDGLLGWMHMRE